MTEQEQRMIAIRAARQCHKMGMSMWEFELAVENFLLPDDDAVEACWELMERGELEHLMKWVWTFLRK